MGSDPHGPNRLLDYIQTHQTVMQQFVASGFVLRDGTSIDGRGSGLFGLSGTVECLGNIVLFVSKTLMRVDGSGSTLRVQTTQYSYSAVLAGRGSILRYDSPHTHRPYHHVHRYDVLNGDSEGTIETSDWPHLSHVLEELRSWYYANFDRLADH